MMAFGLEAQNWNQNVKLKQLHDSILPWGAMNKQKDTEAALNIFMRQPHDGLLPWGDKMY